MAEVKKVWNAEGNRLYLGSPSQEFEKLENAIYKVGQDNFGRLYLAKSSDKFTFDYKLYGLETALVNRVIKTYNATPHGNLGILLNGLKGTGKTVSSKIMANSLNQPIILVEQRLDGIHQFLNSIPQNITIFIDEYEKVFGESSEMLTIMDGASNSTFRRVFLFTTNNLYVDQNLIQRPGRIRYMKKFEDLKPSVVEEIIDDVLEYPEFKQACIDFICNLETITVDIVKAILGEVNIHQEAPSEFEAIFNVKKIKGKFNVQMREEDGRLVELASNVKVYPKPMYNEGHVGYYFEVDNQRIGQISRVINFSTIEVEPFEGDNGKKLGFDEPILIRVEDADTINYSYAYDDSFGVGFGTGGMKKSTKEMSDLAKNIIKQINRDEYGDECEDTAEPVLKAKSKAISLGDIEPVAYEIPDFKVGYLTSSESTGESSGS
jgi:DNA-directed RNA polymerase subunit F